jgi:hypothetical protein
LEENSRKTNAKPKVKQTKNANLYDIDNFIVEGQTGFIKEKKSFMLNVPIPKFNVIPEEYNNDVTFMSSDDEVIF